MPWIHFHVGYKGIAQACCIANIPYGDANKLSLDEIWQGDAIHSLRSKFRQGVPDKRCSGCIKREAGGATSIRQETFQKFPEFELPESDLNPALPIYFDIRFSNICNFRCRTCWHGASSRWFEEAKQMGTNASEKAIIKNIDDFKCFIQSSGEALLGCEEIYFAGGEPLVTEEHYLLLEWLLTNNKTDVRLRYNSNFSTLNFKKWDAVKLWSKFDHVEILASVDASEKLGEYIRKEMNWNKILENRKKINDLENISFKLAPTISVFNVIHLPEFYTKALAIGLIEEDEIYFNILERPFHYNVQSLPIGLKYRVLDVYSTAPFHISFRRQIEEVSKFMMTEDLSKHHEKFRLETNLLDDMRDEDWNNLSPY